MTTTESRTQRAGLDVGTPLADFVENEALAGTGVETETFWAGLAEILRDLAPVNRALLAERDRLQAEIDEFHRRAPGRPDPVEYQRHLESIGYLTPWAESGRVRTQGVDIEVAETAGPQLVVPLLNARFAVNAANARWGSLYDALYGTDAISEEGNLARGTQYNPERGAAVVAFGRRLLDDVAPLESGSHADVLAYRVADGELRARCGDREVGLAEPLLFVGYTGHTQEPTSILLKHHGLHLDVIIDRDSPVGSSDAAGVADIVLESAVTTIMDLEDSVAAVDVDDKVLGYRNWLGLMRGTLTADVEKAGRSFRRELASDRSYIAADGSDLSLAGRSLLWVRNVGHLMTTDAVRFADGTEVPEGILDAVMTVLGSLADLRGPSAGKNSREGSIYIVKPKMHGPAEVSFAGELFARVEALFGLPAATIKIGIMDEERRTSANLAACIAAVADRVAFINTGFLDRTGDEIHTSLHAGAMVPKGHMRDETWLRTYEASNVATGTRAGLRGRGQIGKGMWAMPDLMRDMLEQKGAQLRAGATTAWVPSPTAATLHALHYHETDSTKVADSMADQDVPSGADLLSPPLADAELDRDLVRIELDNNVQSILGYVVRWVNQGIGCSKVPDIHGVALMEDRATLRISSQLLANWLMHGVISEEDIDDSLLRLSGTVDEQNAADPTYEPLSGAGAAGLAFTAARRLIIEGAQQPNGYTEPLLHELRRAKKAEARAVVIAAGDRR